jgi:NAD(P)H-hydrate epimerase
LAKPELGKATQSQLDVLKHAGIVPLEADETETALHEASVVVDALVGYSLSGAPRGSIAKLIQSTKKQTNAKSIISLDIPSGVDATTGETLGDAIEPTITVTLALPKTGLRSVSGDVILADIGIPREVYQSIGIQVEPFFKDQYWIPIERRQ